MTVKNRGKGREVLADYILPDDTAGGTDGETVKPISSNAFYDHVVDTSTHGVTTIDGVTERDAAIATHAAILDAHMGDMLAECAVGYYDPCNIVIGWGTSAVTALTLYAHPIKVIRAKTFDRIGVRISVAGAATKIMRLGIYNDSGGYPSSLALDCGTIAVDASGWLTITISKQLTKATYWLGVVSDGTPTMYYASYGWSPRGNFSTPHYNGAICDLLTLALADTTLPDPFTAGAADGRGIGIPLLRLGSLD